METIRGNLIMDCKTRNVMVSGASVPVTDFLVAENRYRNGKDYKRLVKVTIWRKLAESLSPYLLKGKEVEVSGYLEAEGYIKKNEDGTQEGKAVLVIKNPTDVQLLGKKITREEEIFGGEVVA